MTTNPPTVQLDADGNREVVSGSIFWRTCKPQGMKKDEVVLGHKHNFDHTTFCKRGALEICLLDVTEFETVIDEEGYPIQRPLNATVVLSKIIRADDMEDDHFLVMKDRFHMIRALEDGTVYRCVYSHQMPQALLMEGGSRPHKPTVRVDPDGTIWYRKNEKIVDTSAWLEPHRSPAYR